MTIHPTIESTEDGSQTLRHPVFGDSYHSQHGALSESRHIFIRNGFETISKPYIRILEAGFGSGLNALLTLHAAETHRRKVHYTAVELYPIDTATVHALGYASDPRFTALHEALWDTETDITPLFRLKKIAGDLANQLFETTFDLVYYDAFAPDTQPELWSEELFGKIFARLEQGGLLVTYSAKGSVKRALRAAGFEVRRLEGAPGKRHMIQAIKR